MSAESSTPLSAEIRTAGLRLVGSYSMTSPNRDLWQPRHGQFDDSATALARIEAFATDAENAGLKVDSVLVDKSLRIMSKAYEDYNDPEPEPSLAGGHAFIGPSRLSLINMEAIAEAYGTLPFLKDINPAQASEAGIPEVNLKVMRLVELIPPRILERYRTLPGGIVYAPATSQLPHDERSIAAAAGKARTIVADTVSFAKRQGANVVGLGATLPSITRYGLEIRKRVNADEIEITTGHGGTAWLAGHLALEALDRQKTRYSGKQGIGILGLGAMGSVLAEFIAGEIEEVDITLFDKRLKKAARIAENLKQTHNGRIRIANDKDELFEGSSVIVSAVTRSIDITKIRPRNLEGRVIIDDSQPAAFEREAAIKRGAALLWVIGHSEDGLFARESDWNCGDSMVGQADLFGCEAEAAAISTVDPGDRKKYAIDHRATPEDIHKIGRLFVSRRISLASAQSHGQPTHL
jgi:predicted amino acid dehydrogenase